MRHKRTIRAILLQNDRSEGYLIPELEPKSDTIMMNLELWELEPCPRYHTCDERHGHGAGSGGGELSLRTRILEAMGRIGMAGGVADAYLAEAILVAAQDRVAPDGMVDMDNAIYPALARKFGATRSSMEKAMRSRIEASWTHVDLETLSREYTAYVDPRKGKPELRKFIAYYANQFRRYTN